MVDDVSRSHGGGAGAVSIDGLGMVFNQGTGNEVRALEGISLDVGAGEFVSLIGPSGCGKSTLLRCIADLIHPTSGSVSVFGESSAEARRNRRYGMAFQAAGLFDWRKVAANIELPLEIGGGGGNPGGHTMNRSARRDRALEMLKLVRLEEFADHYPWQLSGGMQQRVAIARALSFQPRLLLMDEPFGALDEMTREYMQAELLRIHAETDTTVVFVTHSIPEAVFLSNRVVVLSPRPGRIHSVIEVDLGERNEDTREAPEFFERTTEVREALRAISLDGAVADRGVES